MTTYLKITLLFFLLFGVSFQTLAQTDLGIIWEQPEDILEAQSELAFFEDSGIEYLEISHPVDNEILALLDRASFTIFVRFTPEFLTLTDIKNQQNELVTKFSSDLDNYRSYPGIRAFGLLNNSQINHPDFETAFAPVLGSVSTDSSSSFYGFNTGQWFYIDQPDQAFATSIPNKNFDETHLSNFNELMESGNELVFLHSNWLIEGTNDYPELAKSISDYKDSQHWQLALPNAQEISSFPNWLVLLLLISWAGLSIQIRFLPYIRPMLFRYYLAHRFFVDDILHYRERAALGGILLMIQHAVFSGIVLYITSRLFFSPTGVDAFFYHLPALAITGSNHFSFFFIGLIVVLLTQVIALLWLHLPAKNIEHFSQTINLYAGVFFLDFILVTIMLALYLTGFGITVLTVMAGFFVIVWYAAFNIAAIDMSSNMNQGRLTYLLLTIGLHATVSVGLFIYALSSNELMQVFELAALL